MHEHTCRPLRIPSRGMVATCNEHWMGKPVLRQPVKP